MVDSMPSPRQGGVSAPHGQVVGGSTNLAGVYVKNMAVDWVVIA